MLLVNVCKQWLVGGPQLWGSKLVGVVTDERRKKKTMREWGLITKTDEHATSSKKGLGTINEMQ